MTLAEIKTAAAAILQVPEADFTVGSTDMFLVAVNQVRRDAEQNWDFEFQRRLVQVSVDPVTGGSLANAVLHSDGTTAVKIKTVIDMGEFDDQDNLRPVEWTSVGEGLERQRADSRWRYGPRYPTDGQAQCAPAGGLRYEVINDTIFRWPKSDLVTEDITVGLEVYAYADDWISIEALSVAGTPNQADAVGNYTQANFTINNEAVYIKPSTSNTFALWWTGSLWYFANTNFFSGGAQPANRYDSAALDDIFIGRGTFTGTPTITTNGSLSDIWTEQAHQYLLWGAIIHLNYIFKTFVPRTEGNLPPPTTMMEAGLNSLKLWDEEKFDKFRRHGR